MHVEDAESVVRRFTAAMRAGEIRTCRELMHQDCVFSEAPSLPFGGDWSGPDGFVAMIKAVSRHYRIDLAEPQVADAESAVLVEVRGTLTGRATGRSMPIDCIDVYRVSEGLITRVDVFYKDARAVAQLCETQPDPAPASASPSPN